MEHILEWREYKKTKSNYYTKRIPISKIQLEDICDKLNLHNKNIKFLSSGKYGNAYKIDDKVLKITSDKTEANSISNLISSNISNESIVKYYSINRYKLGSEWVYIILMDYLTPIMDYINNSNYYDFTTTICNIIYDNWDEMSISEFNEYIEEIYSIDKLPKLAKDIISKFWKLYNDLKYLKKCPDLHYNNLGIDKNGNIVLFDFTDFKRINKFDKPDII